MAHKVLKYNNYLKLIYLIFQNIKTKFNVANKTNFLSYHDFSSNSMIWFKVRFRVNNVMIKDESEYT